MDPHDLSRRAAEAAGQQYDYHTNPPGHRHGGGMYHHPPPHYASNQGYAPQHHVQHAPINITPTYAAMPPVGHSSYRASPPNVMPLPHQQTIMRSSPYFDQSKQATNSSAIGQSVSGKDGTTAIGFSAQSSHTFTLPQPESEPLPPIPPMPKTIEPNKLHHHPDLPFLVTHWVDHYASTSSFTAASEPTHVLKRDDSGSKNILGEDDDERKEALLRLKRAARDMAWAFETLGVYGDSSKFTVSAFNMNLSAWPTTYSDLKRKYAPLLSSVYSTDTSQNPNSMTLLDSLVTASTSTSNEASKSVLETVMPWSLLEASYEGTVPTRNPGTLSAENAKRQSSALGVGRRVGETDSDAVDRSLKHLLPSYEENGFAFQNPVLMGGTSSNNTNYFTAADGALAMKLGSDFDMFMKKAAEASRKYLSARSKVHEEVSEFQKTRMAMQAAMDRAETSCSTLASVVASRQYGDQFASSSDLDRHRVIAQLERRLGEMHLKISAEKKIAADSKKKAEDAFQGLSSVYARYSDPRQFNGNCQFSMRCIGDKNILKPLFQRYGCLSQTRQISNFALPWSITQQYQGRRRPTENTHARLSLLKSRLSHAVTINCHLVYPVYCLKFDRTGKYFITGSDDQLVKLFHLGAGPKHGDRSAGKQFSYGANLRGAVLVCTLRGHAGVVTDVDVSVDNAMLATASADGDVRVWGLRDGCPVAILRGHKDGANMVSCLNIVNTR